MPRAVRRPAYNTAQRSTAPTRSRYLSMRNTRLVDSQPMGRPPAGASAGPGERGVRHNCAPPISMLGRRSTDRLCCTRQAQRPPAAGLTIEGVLAEVHGLQGLEGPLAVPLGVGQRAGQLVALRSGVWVGWGGVQGLCWRGLTNKWKCQACSPRFLPGCLAAQ